MTLGQLLNKITTRITAVDNRWNGKLVSNTDLNTLTTPGTYYCTTGCTNAPRDWFVLQVIRPNPLNDSQVNQFGFSASGAIFYSRALTGGAWTAWKSVSLS